MAKTALTALLQQSKTTLCSIIPALAQIPVRAKAQKRLWKRRNPAPASTSPSVIDGGLSKPPNGNASRHMI